MGWFRYRVYDCHSGSMPAPTVLLYAHLISSSYLPAPQNASKAPDSATRFPRSTRAMLPLPIHRPDDESRRRGGVSSSPAVFYSRVATQTEHLALMPAISSVRYPTAANSLFIYKHTQPAHPSPIPIIKRTATIRTQSLPPQSPQTAHTSSATTPN